MSAHAAWLDATPVADADADAHADAPAVPMPLEAGRPGDDARTFRRCLGQFATGVTIVTAAAEDGLLGMTVNSFSALSLEPPLVLWSIRKSSAALAGFRQAGHFAINVLSAEQVALSSAFASPGADRYRDVAWVAGRGGAPLLNGCIAHFECRLAAALDGGDHLILVGEVEHYARWDGEPLLFAQGRYAVAQDHPGVSLPPAAVTDPVAPDAGDGGLLRLLHYASYQMSTAFDTERQAAGLSVAQLRIAGWLRTGSRNLAELRRLAYLGEADATDAVDAMLERGELVRDGDGRLSLTDTGRAGAEAIARRSAAFEATLLTDLPRADVIAARRVLTTLGARSANAVQDRSRTDGGAL